MEWITRAANLKDIPRITEIYNQGIEDRVATFETRRRDVPEMAAWLTDREDRYLVVVIEDERRNDSGLGVRQRISVQMLLQRSRRFVDLHSQGYEGKGTWKAAAGLSDVGRKGKGLPQAGAECV